MTPHWSYYKAAASEDWYTYQNGAGTISDLSDRSDQTITYQSAYPKQTDLDAIRMESSGGTWPLSYTPMSEADASGSFSPYLAIYVQAGLGFSANDTDGWHVFENANVTFGSRDRWRIPIAWPSGSNNDDGRFGINQTTNTSCVVVTLSQAPLASGSGGTDGWSVPSFLPSSP